MEKIFIVWYHNEELDKTGIWGIYSDTNKAETVIQYIKANWGYRAWWNEEEVQ